ncbi:AraC family transcriptional regulator [Phenylobacterium sp.]|uniref:AraC family transcriptional regulator n=1 Tax=Phenylobacterium sp. TaxID=1871053 RepID=UPI002F3ECEDA
MKPMGPVSRYTEILLETARENGLDLGAIFGDEPVFSTQGRKPKWSGRHLLSASVRLKQALGDEFWGLLGDSQAPVGTFRYICDVSTLCNTLEDALHFAYRLYSLITQDVEFHLDVEGDVAIIRMELPGCHVRRREFLFEWWLWLWHFIAQWLVGSEIELLRADFPHAAIADQEYYASFGSNCCFQSNSAKITFNKSVLKRLVVRTSADVAAMHRRNVISLSTPDIVRSCRTLVTASLKDRLEKTGALPTLQEIAREHGVCDQTLRRRLQAENTSYRALKAQVRRDLTRRYMGKDGAPLSEVAARAGFSDPNGLSRAIRSWSGMGVKEYRRSLVEASSD